MLSWVTNSPDLTDDLLARLRARWVRAERRRAGRPYAGAALDDAPAGPGGRAPPTEEIAGAPARRPRPCSCATASPLRRGPARRCAEEHGIGGVPFLVNIHGTEGGSGAPFPIGISQLVETYAGVPGMVSGSDHYLGEMTVGHDHRPATS